MNIMGYVHGCVTSPPATVIRARPPVGVKRRRLPSCGAKNHVALPRTRHEEAEQPLKAEQEDTS